jgi:YHS domain-containing protein
MFEFLGRIFEILAVFAVLRSLLGIAMRVFRGTGGPGNAGTRNPGPDAPARKTVADPDNPSASTLLHQDPVCGTYVAAGSSFRKICNGEVFHFCSEECRDKYAA